MTSRKRKQARLDESRLQRAKAPAAIDPRHEGTVPTGAVMADPEQLIHNNTYGFLPRFYLDKAIICRQCGKEEVWPAERQKWWYEVAKGHIDTQAVFCHSCRGIEKQRKEEARRIHLEGLERKKPRNEPR